MVQRWLVTVVAVGAPAVLSAGVAQADEVSQNSNNGDGSRVTVVDVGQVDDPAEDVLEHFLHLGEFSEGPEAAEAAAVPDPVDVASVAAVPAAYR